MWLAILVGLVHMITEPARKSRVGSETLPHKVRPNEDVRDLSGGDCDTPI